MATGRASWRIPDRIETGRDPLPRDGTRPQGNRRPGWYNISPGVRARKFPPDSTPGDREAKTPTRYWAARPDPGPCGNGPGPSPGGHGDPNERLIPAPGSAPRPRLSCCLRCAIEGSPPEDPGPHRRTGTPEPIGVTPWVEWDKEPSTVSDH